MRISVSPSIFQLDLIYISIYLYIYIYIYIYIYVCVCVCVDNARYLKCFHAKCEILKITPSFNTFYHIKNWTTQKLKNIKIQIQNRFKNNFFFHKWNPTLICFNRFLIKIWRLYIYIYIYYIYIYILFFNIWSHFKRSGTCVLVHFLPSLPSREIVNLSREISDSKTKKCQKVRWLNWQELSLALLKKNYSIV